MKDITELDNKENMMGEGHKKELEYRTGFQSGKRKNIVAIIKKKKKNNTKQTKNNETGKIRVEKVRLALEMHTDYLPLPPSLERLPPAIFNLYQLKAAPLFLHSPIHPVQTGR